MTVQLLFAEDIAELHGMSRRHAHRWLERLEREHGSTVVGRANEAGRVRRYTTVAALDAVSPERRRAESDLRGRLEELVGRVVGLESAFRRLQDEFRAARTGKASEGHVSPPH